MKSRASPFSFLALICLSACSGHEGPQVAFDHATQTFRRGDLAAATEEANKGYKDFHGLSTEWAWKFKTLEANALVWRGMGDRALALIASETTPPPTIDLKVQKARLEASANLALSHFTEAEQKLAEADRLCASSNSPACASVVFARGGLEMVRGHFPQAQSLFEQTLSSARSNGDGFVEANVLMNLGWSALQQEHFDEALDWSEAAYRLSTALKFEDLAQTALGNHRMGVLQTW